MRITISNKKLKKKPENKGKYFGKKGTPNRIQFRTGNFRLSDFEEIIGNGHTLAYQCMGDDAMSRKAGYIGSDYIIVDIDETELCAQEVLARCKHCPTILHTTFSNLKQSKNFKHCYHLIFCLSSTLYGEESFYKAFSYFTEGIEELYDKKAKDCHRIVFTSNKILDNYEYINTNTVYNIEELPFLDNYFDKAEDLFSEESLSNKSSLSPSSSLFSDNKINAKMDNTECAENEQATRPVQNSHDLDTVFLHDIENMSRRDFIIKYDSIYEFTTSTPVEYNAYGYVKIEGQNYCEVDRKIHYKDGKIEVQKVQIGKRDNQLFKDAIHFYYAKGGMSKEELIYCLTKEVYMHYDNSDRQLTNKYIVDKAMHVFNLIDSLHPLKCNKRFKIDKQFWKKTGKTTMQAVAEVRKMLKDEEIGSFIDLDMTLEDNIKMMKKNGIKIEKRRLTEFCRRNEVTLTEKNEIRDRRIMELHSEGHCTREIAKILEGEGVSVSKSTVANVLRRCCSMNDYDIAV